MPFLQTTVEYAAVLGARDIQPNESRFNWRSVGVLLVFGLNFISVFAHLLLDARTLLDYAVSTFSGLILLCAWLGFFVMTMKVSDLFQCIRKLEALIKDCKQIFIKIRRTFNGIMVIQQGHMIQLRNVHMKSAITILNCGRKSFTHFV